MLRKSLPILIVLILIGFQGIAQSMNPIEEEAKIKDLLETYKNSINKADSTLGATIFLNNDQVNFIHPKGHEKGWEGIKIGIYERFQNRFSQRDLKSYNESITIFDDVAVLEFYWVYDAVFSGEDPAPMQSKGRETQILKKFGDDWKIIHVHYSSMPKTGEREGF